jgi:hypothetical protein
LKIEVNLKNVAELLDNGRSSHEKEIQATCSPMQYPTDKKMEGGGLTELSGLAQHITTTYRSNSKLVLQSRTLVKIDHTTWAEQARDCKLTFTKLNSYRTLEDKEKIHIEKKKKTFCPQILCASCA